MAGNKKSKGTGKKGGTGRRDKTFPSSDGKGSKGNTHTPGGKKKGKKKKK
ncbi:hypothetical protein LCGC14_1129010 [marine sediment metagenome]|uniref:Uncharacterized protein n=1 Tax=marine sediment metagenome TaxID=412755 RepID=A0A0F9M1R9_9ZZZZ